MIPVPTNRLIIAAGICAAVGLLAPVAGQTPAWGIGLAAILFAVAGIDLLHSWMVRSVPEVRSGGTLRLSRDRPGQLSLLIARRKHDQSLRVGVALDSTLSLEADEAVYQIPPGDGWFATTWKSTGRDRGRFTQATVALEHDSMARLWQLRSILRVPVDIRVYPNLFSEKRPLAALFLARNQLGARLQRTVGRGREFEKLRDYLPGDGFDEIHWKATAKRNRPITKVFQSERTQEIYVIVDCSRLAGRTVVHEGREQPLLERFLAASLLLLLAAERQGDRFGFVVFDDRIRTFIAAGRGRGHYGACREAAAGLHASDAVPDVAELVRSLQTRIRRRTMLFVLTDLSDPVVAEDFGKHAPPLARQHVTLLSQIPPPEVAPLFQGGEVREIGDIYGAMAGHARWVEILGVQRRLKAAGVRATTVRHESLAAELIGQYVEMKQRQAL